MTIESECVEYKEKTTDDLYKEVIAFANTTGGTLYVGIDDEGRAVGIDDIDDSYTRITNGIRDAILPDVTMFVKYTLQENHVIRIVVGEGTLKPYYLKSKGLKPSGVYVRHGAFSVPASFDQIRQMIKNTDGDTFEGMRSLKQELTFEEAAKTFDKNNVEFGEEKYIALGIRNLPQDLYTNLGLIVSDQCEHTVKVAVFADENNTIFKDHKVFSGSIFKQLGDTFDYLSLCNQDRSVIQGLDRIDHWDYPSGAFREALLNALVHRDYSYSGSVIININDHGMEFISIGGLVPGFLAEDLRSGISQPRNMKLAEMFHRLHFIESYGTGIRKIYAFYEGCPEQPVIEVTHNTFKITLPNINVAGQKATNTRKTDADSSKIKITPQFRMILDYLSEYGEIGDDELQELLDVKRTRAYILTRQMAEAGLIDIVGRGINKKYRSKQ